MTTASREGEKTEESSATWREMRNVACGILAAWAVTTVSPVIAANQVMTEPLIQFNSFFPCLVQFKFSISLPRTHQHMHIVALFTVCLSLPLDRSELETKGYDVIIQRE